VSDEAQYELWGYVEVDRREGDFQHFQSCARCGALVKWGREHLHDGFHAFLDNQEHERA
jgi:hypothetical protein